MFESLLLTLLEAVLAAAAIVLLLPATVLLLQVTASLAPARSRGMPRQRPSVAILIPAHNESLLIAGTLQSISPQLTAGDRLLVVADNCTDDTGRIAAAAGAEVAIRADCERRGKGYALDYGVRHLQADPPEVVIVIDADCQVATGAIDRLARICATIDRPVQALYLMRAPAGAGLKTRIAAFAYLVKNKVRALGYYRLGLPCQLMGSGMAFPWAAISAAPLANGHIVEDLMLGINLARAGTPPQFCPEAVVTSLFPDSTEGMAGQRRRWEHGHLSVIVAEAPRLFADAAMQENGDLLAMACDLCVPPLALLMLFALVVSAASLLLFAGSAIALPLWLASTVLAMLGIAVLLAWMRHGRQVISLAELAYAPFYAVWKIPLYFLFLMRRQVEWVRSRRDLP